MSIPIAEVENLKMQISKADALVIATPEYNYSVSGALKNAIDWVSRPAYKSVLKHKPTAVLSASMAFTGGVRAQAHLKAILSGTLTTLIPAPEAVIGSVQNLVNDGVLTDTTTRQRLDKLLIQTLNAVQ